MTRASGEGRDIIYFDHGATSWPKAPGVVEAMVRAETDLGGNPGRGTHRMAIDAARAIFGSRKACAELLGVADSRNLLFSPGCTHACNLMLKGVLKPGDRVVVGSMEHNAVARPLAHLLAQGVDVVIVNADETGYVSADEVERAVKAAETRAVVCQHASNLTGTIQPVADMADIARDAGAVMLVDGAQGVGHLEVDLGALGVHAYAASGHKGMLGPRGIGLLYLDPEMELDLMIEGGTAGGSSSSLAMPDSRPERFEPGTPNVAGICGLGAAAGFLGPHGPEQRRLETALVRTVHEGVLDIGGFRVLGPEPGVPRVPVVSIVHESAAADRIAFELDKTYGIACRAGLHCAPWGHESVGTLETGAVRLGVGFGNTPEDVNLLLDALRRIVA